MTIVKLTDKENLISSRECDLYDEITIGRREGDIICEDNPYMHSLHCQIKDISENYYI